MARERRRLARSKLYQKIMAPLLRQLPVVVFAALICATFARAGEDAAGAAASNEAKNIARMNCGAQLEWTLPDGSRSPTRGAAFFREGTPAVVIMDDDTVSCPLHQGRTTLIVSLPQAATLDRFTFRE